MPGPGKVALVRPDGSVLQATPEQAEKLKLLGYREEEFEERSTRVAADAKDAYYTTPGQQVRAGGAALVRGATLGVSDYLVGDEHTAERARHNPGTSMAFEALGALVPLVLSDGAAGAAGIGKVAAATPTALLSRGARAVAGGIENRFARSAVAGAVEGAGFGGAQAANHAYLTGDPITAETILHGAKWGAVFGGGLGTVGAGVSAVGERIGAKLATEKAAAEAARLTSAPATSVAKVGQESYHALHKEVSNLSAKLKVANDSADAMISGTANKLIKLGENSALPAAELSAIRQEIQRAAKQARKAVNKGSSEQVTRATARYEAAVAKASDRLGITGQLGNPAKSFTELASMKAVQKELKSFPKTMETFASMTPKRAEDVFATLEKAKSLSAYPELSKAVEGAVTKLSESLGLKTTGVEGLRTAWGASKEAITLEREAKRQVTRAAAAEANVAAGKGGGVSLGYGGNAATWAMGRAIGGPGLGGAAATLGIRKLLSGETLAAMRNHAVNRIKTAAATYMPKGGAAIRRVGPRIEPLAVKLDGTFDNSSKTREDLAAARVKEFWDAYPTINDRLYKGVEAVGISQPDLGPAVHAAGVAAFQSMLESVPRDPGVVSGLKSIWKPSFLQAEVLGRRLEVFHDPIGQAEMMLSTGNFDPIKVKTLKQVAPAVYAELRQGVIERIAQPGMMEKMTYNDQIGVGTMLDIPIHSSMRPEHIASSQQLFLVRNQPLPMPVQGGEGKEGGRPSATDNANATKSQKITDR